MTQEKPLANNDKKQVSNARKIVSIVILLGLLVLLGIEGRAGFGASMATKALNADAKEGIFEPRTVTEEQFNAKLPMSPAITKIAETKSTIEYKYEWFSFIRPQVKSLPPSVLYATFLKSEPRYALFFGKDPLANDALPASANSDGESSDGDSSAGESSDGESSAGESSAGDSGDAPAPPPPLDAP